MSTPETLINTCGSEVMTEARSASVLPVAAILAITMMAVSNPSPVVAKSDSTTCPDCSPPRL